MKKKSNKHRKHRLYVARKSLQKRKKKRKRHLDNTLTAPSLIEQISPTNNELFNSLLGEYEYKCMNNKVRYDKFSVQLILSEEDVYPDKDPIDVSKALAKYSREDIIKIVFILNMLYGNSDVRKLHMFFSPSNKDIQNDLTNRINKFKRRNSQPINYAFTSYQTGLEILRHTFALPVADNSTLNSRDFEATMIRIILSLNKISTDYTLDKKDESNLYKLVFINNASNKYIKSLGDKDEIKTQLLTQMYMGYSFFMFITSDKRHKPLYDLFLKKYKIKDWRKYYVTVLGLIVGCEGLVARYDPNLNFDIDQLLDVHVVEELCWNYDKVLKYASDHASDKTGNSDYRYFRSKPLMKMKNGDYVVLNKSLLIDKLYNSLYFDFLEIASELDEKGFAQTYTTDFVEKAVFNQLIVKCASSKRYTLVSEEQCKKGQKMLSGELGPPDYILKSKNSNILFECKDIRLNGWVLEQRDYSLIIDEIQNKLLCKKWSYDANGKKIMRPKSKWRPIGIGQLAGHAKDIQNSKFPYSKIEKDKPLYTVLVLGDRKLNFDAFHQIANRWFDIELDGYDRTNIKPLIIVTLGTLFKYHKLFTCDGFEKYFDEYIESVSIPFTQLPDIANRCVNFDDYMAIYPYDVHEDGEKIMKELLGNRYNP